MSSSASDVEARKKVGFSGYHKSAVRTTRVRNGGVGSVNESEG